MADMIKATPELPWLTPTLSIFHGNGAELNRALARTVREKEHQITVTDADFKIEPIA